MAVFRAPPKKSGCNTFAKSSVLVSDMVSREMKLKEKFKLNRDFYVPRVALNNEHNRMTGVIKKQRLIALDPVRFRPPYSNTETNVFRPLAYSEKFTFRRSEEFFFGVKKKWH